MTRPARLAAAALASLASCTSASVYEVSGAGQEGPDRALFQGTICAPLPTGTEFPVKIVFAVEGGSPPVQPQDTAAIISALQGVESAAAPGTEFALIGYHTVALAFTNGFVGAGAFGQALTQLQGATAQQTGPVSLKAPLDLAEAFISGDMQTGCTATLRRTHYYVMLLVASEDVTCTDPAFASALQSICQTGNNADQLQTNAASPYCSCIGQTCSQNPQCTCEDCILQAAALNLKNLGPQYGGDVTVVPIYFRDFNAASDAGALADPVIQEQVGAIASAVGSASYQYPTTDLATDLAGFDFSSLLSAPTLTRLYAWNRNVLARQGQEVVDSDGDGISDDDETNVYHSNPVLYSSAQDGIGDGVKTHLGLDPNKPLTLTQCDPTQDTDGDRLNDCEEQLLETDACAADTDVDGLSDLVELHSGTNPLVPEANQDTDGDGVSNAIEVMSHSDPLTSDLAFRADRATWSSVEPGTPTADGRPCYDFTIGNVSLMATQGYQDGFVNIPAGANFIYLLGEWSYQGGAEISQLFIQQVIYQAPAQPSPPSPILVTPDDFAEGT
ncbi:MAG TPA: calcium-binding protein [Myxococcales bacterium]|nr:calcium-binding protein [Myxococcales bacterium]